MFYNEVKSLSGADGYYADKLWKESSLSNFVFVMYLAAAGWATYVVLK